MGGEPYNKCWGGGEGYDEGTLQQAHPGGGEGEAPGGGKYVQVWIQREGERGVTREPYNKRVREEAREKHLAAVSTLRRGYSGRRRGEGRGEGTLQQAGPGGGEGEAPGGGKYVQAWIQWEGERGVTREPYNKGVQEEAREKHLAVVSTSRCGYSGRGSGHGGEPYNKCVREEAREKHLAVVSTSRCGYSGKGRGAWRVNPTTSGSGPRRNRGTWRSRSVQAVQG